MAHTVKSKDGSKFYTVTIDPTIAWDSADVFPGGMRIMAIEMAPAAANDAVVVRDGGAAGPRIFSHEAIDTSDIALRRYDRAEWHTGAGRGTHCFPYIAAAEATGAFDVTIEIE